MLALCVAISVCGIAAQAQSETSSVERVERHVSALSDKTLLSAPISQLVDPQRQRLASVYVGRERPLFFVSALFEIAMLLWLWRSGRAAAIRDALRRQIRNVHALRFTYVLVLALIVAVAALPVSFIQYRISIVLGLSQQSPAEWFGYATSTAIINALLGGILFTVMLALAQATRLWYAYGAVFLVAFVVLASFASPVVLSPWLHPQQELPNAMLAAHFAELEHRAGISDVPIVIEATSQGARADEAHVAGFGPSARIVLSDGLVRDSTPAELSFIVARSSVHVARYDVARGAIYAALWLIVAAALSVLISDRIGFRRDDDPLSRIALLGTFLGLAILVLMPIANAYSRRLEARADRLALAITGDPAGAVRTIVRAADANLTPVCPPPVVRRYFLTFPPTGTRIGVIRGTGDPCP